MPSLVTTFTSEGIDDETGVHYHVIDALNAKGERKKVWEGVGEDERNAVLDMIESNWIPSDVDDLSAKEELEFHRAVRPGIDCPRCGDEFDQGKNRKAKNSKLCIGCAVELDAPLDPDDADRIAEAAFDRWEGRLWDGVDMTTYDPWD